MDEVLLSIESSNADLVPAASGLAALLGGRATVFVPLPPTRPHARMAAEIPAVVVVALGLSEVATLGDWLLAYLDRYPDATATCTVAQRSIRLDAERRSSVRDALEELFPR